MADTKSTPATPTTVKMDIEEDITISNLNGTTKFPKGRDIEVPEELADEVRRINTDYLRYKSGLLTKQEYIVNSGSIAVGGGAGK